MITPVGSTPMEYYELHKNQFTHAKITFIDSNVVFEDGEFESNGITVSQYMNSETDLTFGTASCVEAEIHLFRSNKTDVLKWSDEFLLQFGYDDGEGGIDWFDIGYFTGSKPERTQIDVITFRAYDRMIGFDIQADDFIDLLDFTTPMTLSDIYTALCTYVGVSSVSGDEIAANMAHSFSKCPIGHGYSCRDILGYIAEAAGCYAIITPAGYVKMVWYTDHTDDFSLKRDDIFAVDISEVDWSYDPSMRKKWIDLETEKWKDLENLTWRELEGYYSPTKINALKFIYSDEDVGITVPNSLSTKNVYTIINNPFLYGSTIVETTGYLTNLYNRLSAFGIYVPVKLDCVGNVFVETGDIVRLEFSDGNYGHLPVFNRILQYNGALVCSYEATGNLERTPISGSDKKIMEVNGKIHIVRKTVDELYSQINDPTTGLATEISQTEQEVSALATKKARIYFSSTTPTGTQDDPLAEGDLWIDTSNNNQLKRYNGSVWGDASFDDPDKYTVYSGIVINSSGVQITGNKYILLEAGDDKWTFDSKGLKYIDDNNPVNISFQITNIDDRDTYATGIFTKYDSGLGKLMFIPICKSVNHTSIEYWYGIINLEIVDEPDYTDPVNGTVYSGVHQLLYPEQNDVEFLGKEGHIWGRIYGREICGRSYDNVGGVLGQLLLSPSSRDGELGKCVVIQYVLADPTDPTSGTLRMFANRGSGGLTITAGIDGYIYNKSTTETDLNNITDKGQYWIPLSQMTNKPSTLQSGSYCLEVCRYSSTHLTQIIYTDDSIYTRMLYSGTWGNWYKFTGTQV